MLTAAVAFAAGAALAWLCLRGDTRPTPGTRPGRADPTTPWTDLPERPWTDWLPDPTTTAELHAWIAATDDTPVTWQARPNPPRWHHRARRITTGEIRQVVYGGAA